MTAFANHIERLAFENWKLRRLRLPYFLRSTTRSRGQEASRFSGVRRSARNRSAPWTGRDARRPPDGRDRRRRP